MLLLLRFNVFFEKSKKRDYLRFLRCFTRFLKLWKAVPYWHVVQVLADEL